MDRASPNSRLAALRAKTDREVFHLLSKELEEALQSALYEGTVGRTRAERVISSATTLASSLNHPFQGQLQEKLEEIRLVLERPKMQRCSAGC